MADQRPDAPEFSLKDRLALRPAEVAQVLGLSERTIRQLLPELPVVRVGTAALVPVDALREWLRDQVKLGKSRVDEITDDVLKSLDRSSEVG